MLHKIPCDWALHKLDFFLNGEKKEKTKEFYENVELSFEGEYLNREKNVFGTEHTLNGEIIFNGEKWIEHGKENDLNDTEKSCKVLYLNSMKFQDF